jgi:hypothetical protein
MSIPHYFDPPHEPDNPGARPIWGYPVRMLIAGGGWNGEDPRLTKCEEGRTRWHKPRRVEVYPGEHLTEPDRNLTNEQWTGKLIRRMVLAGWSLAQVEAALTDPDHIGGGWYRWKLGVGEDVLPDWFADTEPAGEPSTDQLPTTPPRGEVVGSWNRGRNKEQSTWREWQGIKVSEPRALALLRYIRRTGDPTMNQAEREGGVHRRVFRRYVDALEDAGLIAGARERRRTVDGKQRAVKVLRVANEQTVKLHLSAENLPEADRPLWEALRPSQPAQQPAIGLEDVLAQ